MSENLLTKCGTVFDVIYNPTETKLVQTAKTMGKPVCGGAAMLVWQAVKAHEIWNGDTYSNEQIQTLIAEMEAEIQRLFPIKGERR